jgi:hypothetical protein
MAWAEQLGSDLISRQEEAQRSHAEVCTRLCIPTTHLPHDGAISIHDSA